MTYAKRPLLRRWCLSQHPSPARRPRGCVILIKDGFAAVQISETSVSAGWQICRSATSSRSRQYRDSTAQQSMACLDRQDLFAAGHAVGFSGPGSECGPFLSCGGRTLDCSSYFTGTEALFCRDTALTARPENGLPEKFFSDVARQTGSALDTKPKKNWLWKRRRVLVYDGSTVSMPDTPENQAAYPQPRNKNPASAFLWRASRPSFLSPAARCSIWESAATQARGKVNWECFANCGISFAPEMSCWQIGLMCAWTEMVHAQATWSRLRQPPHNSTAMPTFDVENAWERTITLSNGPNRHRLVRLIGRPTTRCRSS